jgi:hypothetical protein
VWPVVRCKAGLEVYGRASSQVEINILIRRDDILYYYGLEGVEWFNGL